MFYLHLVAPLSLVYCPCTFYFLAPKVISILLLVLHSIWLERAKVLDGCGGRKMEVHRFFVNSRFLLCGLLAMYSCLCCGPLYRALLLLSTKKKACFLACSSKNIALRSLYFVKLDLLYPPTCVGRFPEKNRSY
jgi:hypothetical protein